MKAALNVGAAVGGPATATATVTTNTAATATATTNADGIPDPCSRFDVLRGTEHDVSYKEAKATSRRRYHTPHASAARFDLLVRGFGRLRALGLRQTTGGGSPNAPSLPPTSRSRSNASHRPTIAVTRESDYVPVGDLVGTCVGGNVGGFVSPVLVGVGVGDAVGAA